MQKEDRLKKKHKFGLYWNLFTTRAIICVSLITLFLFSLLFPQMGEARGGGEGGEPNPFGPYNKVMYPPDYATFSPIILTTTITPPITGKISSDFGYRYHPITKELDFHKGIDVAAPYGTPIVAAMNGTVTKTGVSNTAGNYIILDHGNGLLTTYMHCSAVIAKENSKIRKGEIIAKVGSTGLSTGNHLHFQMTLNHTVFDPSWVVDLTKR